MPPPVFLLLSKNKHFIWDADAGGEQVDFFLLNEQDDWITLWSVGYCLQTLTRKEPYFLLTHEEYYSGI